MRDSETRSSDVPGKTSAFYFWKLLHLSSVKILKQVLQSYFSTGEGILTFPRPHPEANSMVITKQQ